MNLDSSAIYFLTHYGDVTMGALWSLLCTSYEIAEVSKNFGRDFSNTGSGILCFNLISKSGYWKVSVTSRELRDFNGTTYLTLWFTFS